MSPPFRRCERALGRWQRDAAGACRASCYAGPVMPRSPSAIELLQRLAEAVERVPDEIRLLPDVMDQIRDDFSWSSEPAFQLNLLGTGEGWLVWVSEEKATWAAEGGPERLDSFVGWWEENSPVVLAEGTDGAFYVWDGNHRIAVAHRHGRTVVP